MLDSIFTSLVQSSMTDARTQFAELLNNPDTIALIQNNPEAFTESLTFGHAMQLMSLFMDYTLQNYHTFLCEILKEKGIDISDLEQFRYLFDE